MCSVAASMHQAERAFSRAAAATSNAISLGNGHLLFDPYDMMWYPEFDAAERFENDVATRSSRTVRQGHLSSLQASWAGTPSPKGCQ